MAELFITDPAGPVVRLTLDVNVIPTDEHILRFSNFWYLPAIKEGTEGELETET